MDIKLRLQAWYDRNFRAHSKRYSHARIRAPYPFEHLTDEELRETQEDVQSHLESMKGPEAADPVIDEKVLIEKEMRRRGLDDEE